ncbi:hypothetical protein G0Q17_001828 [Listeria monocytogenes]|uniref:hypothetical protein n=1 Tax=Listeria monocytogenes TaxID=1639 RepID=UPI000E76DBC2|nr:hypothetical protein [Listeria monocytogenes]EAE5878520.1 hypothetical protein [Listeria monocytogenes]EDP7666824.1 hypothetical protein [Listeria monocytogenes]EEO3388783.1 hypothetical protein [Listeria monocytogenes]EEO3692646.1 hypothetical protein [Listeria monocytogenes]EEO6694491.1 hypothetical protein [Listeria monocytogenes]
MEITIRITSAEDAAEAQKVFAALAGETILLETAPKAVEPKAVPKKAPNKKAEIADTEKVEKAVSTKQVEAAENLSEIYKELQGAISLLPNGKNNKKLKQFIVREFNLPNVGRLEEVHYSKVIEYANSLLDNAESKQKTDETAIEESPERKVTKAELEKTVYNLVNAGKREELRKTLDELGVAKISSLEESEYTKAMEALEAL